MRPAALRGWIGPPKGVPAMLTPFHLAYHVTSLNEARALEALDVTDEIFPEREAAIALAHRLT